MTEELKSKIKLAAEKIDKFVDFGKIASKITNKPIRFLVGAIELVDGTIFRVSLTEVIGKIPEEAHPVVDAWLDAFIQEDYLLLVDSTGAFLAELDMLKWVEEEKEKEIYVALLTMLVKLIPKLTNPA
jgi:hypothetical protein